MDIRDRIIDLIRIKGPVIPAQISKEIGTNIIIASAYLSELVDHKKLMLSKLKIGGGTPLYFLPGQEARLQDFSKHLSEKDRRAFEYLKEHKVLRDIDLSPLMRVSLREIKDFAKPLEVMFKENKEIFWKWYTIDTDECTDMIKKLLSGETVDGEQDNKPEEKEVIEEEEKEEEQETNSFNDMIDDNDTLEDEEKEDVQEEPDETNDDFEEQDDYDDKIQEDTAIDEQKHKKPAQEKDSGSQQTLVKKEDNFQADDNIASKDYDSMWQEADSEFIQRLKDYFKIKNIGLKEVKINRKDTDIEFTLNIESSIGKVLYFCKAKNKKKITDGDLSSAYMLGQASKLPTVLIMTGEMTKKAKDMLAAQLKGLAIVKI